jgi:hypothetical protein
VVGRFVEADEFGIAVASGQLVDHTWLVVA